MSNKSATDFDRKVGQRIMTLRRAKGLSQTQLGHAIGVTFQQVQKYENGKNRINGGRLHEVARKLDVSISTLFGDAESTDHGDAFTFLSVPGASDLLKAYTAIANEQLRRDVLAIVRHAARIGARPVPSPHEEPRER